MIMRALSLYAMAPEASFDKMALAKGGLPNSKITQRIKEVVGPLQDDAGAALDFVYPMSGHPPLRSEPGYVVLVSFPFSCFLFN